MLENIVLNIGFVFSLFASVFYAVSIKNNKLVPKARIIYFAATALIVVASVLLMANILAHNFQIAYVYEYSSKGLPAYLLISSFFAGQEGSFLLWALMLAIIGVPLINHSKKYELEPYIMTVFTASIAFFMLLLVIKSPFVYIWDKYPDVFSKGFLPEDGRSLNPILENFWLAIHPPFLFAGYAMLAVPFSYVLGVKIKGADDAAILKSRSWLLASSAVLGAGLILGGFWAYETLGWGGWWGWDPVENSSLIPWLLSVALIHTFVVQKTTGSFASVNYALSAVTYFFVIYSTFLTRSGIIQNSQHSFANTTAGVYYVLLGGMILIILSSLAIYLIKKPKIKQTRESFKLQSREFFLSVGIFLILASTAVITIGTSMPIFNSEISIEPKFYDNVNIPIVILALLVLFVSISYRWREVKFADIKKPLLMNIKLAIIMTCAGIMWGIRDVLSIGILLAAYFVLSVSVVNIIKKIRDKKYTIGLSIAHAGFAILIVGIVFSGTHAVHKSFSLGQNESVKFHDMEIKYIKSQQIDKHLTDREKYQFIIEMNRNGNIMYLNPVTFYKNNQMFREPAIRSGLDRDVYVAPLGLDSMFSVPMNEMQKGQVLNYKKENLSFKFTQFIMTNPDASEIGALVEYDLNGKHYTDTASAVIDMKSLACSPIWRNFTDSDLKFGLMKIIVDDKDRNKSKAVFAFVRDKDLPIKAHEAFTFELTIKPFMNLIWLGAIFIIAGTFWAIFKRKSA